MSLAARDQYREYIERLPFQYLADTPTVRYYTDWSVFEKRMDIGYAYTQHKLPDAMIRQGVDILLGTTAKISDNASSRVEVLDISRGSAPMEPMSLVGVSTKMQAYHAYMWNTGVYIRAAPNKDFGRIVVASTSGDGYMGHHIILDIGDNARGSIVLLDYAGDYDGLKTLVIEVIAGEGSKVDIDTLTIHHKKHAVYKTMYTVLRDRAAITGRSLNTGGAMTRYEETYILEGRESMLQARSSNIARPGTRTDYLLNSIHKGEKSNGFISARGVVLTKGYLAQRGLARIDKEASWSSSEVESHVAILGDDGRGYAIPMLEIHTGDVVKANHEASVTTMLEEHVFYMRSRGLKREEFEKLMITGIIEYSGTASSLNIDPEDLFID